MRQFKWLFPVSCTLSLLACTPAPVSPTPNQPATNNPENATQPSTTNKQTNPDLSSQNNTTAATPSDSNVQDSVTPVLPPASTNTQIGAGSGCAPLINLNGSQIATGSTNNELVPLSRGESHFIPAGKKHRVAQTSLSEKTIWLAIFFSE